MSDETALLRVIRTNPDEDTPRLMYADWLQENGDTDRAEFIRAQLELAGIEPWTERAIDLSIRVRQLLSKRRDSLLAELPLFAKLRADRFRTRFHRGFPYSLDCTASQYLKNAPELARASVLQEWVLNNFDVGVATRFARTKHLARVRGLTISQASANGLQTALNSSHATGLRHLTLDGPCYGDSGPVNRLTDLFELPSVRTLESLRCNYSLSPVGADGAVFRGLVSNPFSALKRLDIDLPDLSDSDRGPAIAAGFWRGIEELTLVPTERHLTTLELLSVPALRAFHCQVMNIRKNGARLFTAPFLRGVIHLTVSCAEDATVDALLASPILEQLRVLDLGSHNLSAQGLRTLFDSGRLTGLVKLTVHGSGINAATGEDAVQVVTETRGLPNLRHLDLGWVISRPSAVALAAAPHLPNLRAVAMLCNSLAVETVADRFAVLEPWFQ